jgi:hypothetical protein
VTLAQHSVISYEHGTPPELLDAAREVVGGEFDLDPCSSAYWNRFVRAKRFIDVVEDGTRAQWNVFPGMRIICNPASFVVDALYRRCVTAWRAGACVFWVGFSVEQMAYLQDDGFLDAGRPRMIPRRRISWMQGVAEQPQTSLFGPPPEVPDPVAQTSPTHSNVMQLLPLLHALAPSSLGLVQVARFEEWATKEGSVPW